MNDIIEPLHAHNKAMNVGCAVNQTLTNKSRFASHRECMIVIFAEISVLDFWSFWIFILKLKVHFSGGIEKPFGL
jgi:hypothetical protein